MHIISIIPSFIPSFIYTISLLRTSTDYKEARTATQPPSANPIPQKPIPPLDTTVFINSSSMLTLKASLEQYSLFRFRPLHALHCNLYLF